MKDDDNQLSKDSFEKLQISVSNEEEKFDKYYRNQNKNQQSYHNNIDLLMTENYLLNL